MDFGGLYEYCSQKKGATEDFPFDKEVLVFKIGGKMFALTNIHALPTTVNLKCDPEYAIELRDRYESINPGYHMSKVHWNTLALEEGDLSDSLIMKLIDHSYDLVRKSLTKKKQKELEEQYGA